MIKKNRRKILVFINNRYLPDHNGAAIAFHRTAKFLSKKYEIEVHRICKKSNFKRTYKLDNIKVSSYPIPDIFYKLKFVNLLYFLVSFSLKLIFKKLKGDTYHCITISFHTLLIILVTKLFNSKIKIIIDHTLNTDLNFHQTFINKFKSKIKKYILSKANVIRSLSPLLSNQLKELGLTNHQLYLPNIDFKHFKIVSKKYKKKLRSKLNISHNKFIILSVGRVSYRKGSDNLINKIKKINKKRKFKLILLGPCEKEFKKYKS